MKSVFRIDFPNTKPIYIFAKNGWVGLIPFVTHIDGNHFNNEPKNLDMSGGMITQLSYWKFIKEWVKR